jgi:glycosyltransferase involved in cell wall biosynthesis
MGPGSTIDALVTALGVDTRARRIGLLRGPARLDALAAADVVVYPSKAEVFGLVPLEALLCGTPAVVCNDSGCGEIVTRVGGGQVVPYGDPAALASAIDAILVARDIWRVRVGAAAARVRRWFASGPVCARVEGVYRDVLAARSDDRSMTGRRGA